jgi:hypothetical protein
MVEEGREAVEVAEVEMAVEGGNHLRAQVAMVGVGKVAAMAVAAMVVVERVAEVMAVERVAGTEEVRVEVEKAAARVGVMGGEVMGEGMGEERAAAEKAAYRVVVPRAVVAMEGKLEEVAEKVAALQVAWWAA